MTRFQRTGALVTGVGLFVSYAVFFAVFGLENLSLPALVGMALLILSATAYVVAGSRETIALGGWTLSWNQLMGVGTILLAIGWAAVSIPLARSSPLLGVAVLAGASSLLFFGYNELTDGPHLDLEATPSRKRLVAIAGIALFSFGLGFVLVAVVF